MKILVVDDEKTIVKGIKFNLENEGYQVDVCYDGETAVDMARHGEYAVILLDLMMPKLDGLGACQRIRQFSTVPIIMLTARSARRAGQRQARARPHRDRPRAPQRTPLRSERGADAQGV